jgi:hypothetical protein
MKMEELELEKGRRVDEIDEIPENAGAHQVRSNSMMLSTIEEMDNDTEHNDAYQDMTG